MTSQQFSWVSDLRQLYRQARTDRNCVRIIIVQELWRVLSRKWVEFPILKLYLIASPCALYISPAFAKTYTRCSTLFLEEFFTCYYPQYFSVSCYYRKGDTNGSKQNIVNKQLDCCLQRCREKLKISVVFSFRPIHVFTVSILWSKTKLNNWMNVTVCRCLDVSSLVWLRTTAPSPSAF